MGRSVLLDDGSHNPTALVRSEGQQSSVLDPPLVNRTVETGARIVLLQKHLILNRKHTRVGYLHGVVGVFLQILHVDAACQFRRTLLHVLLVQEHV